MSGIIKLNSHDGTNNYLKQLEVPTYEGKQAYLLKTPYNFCRFGEVEEGRKFVDPSGGPMLVEGDKVDKYTIVKIVTVPYVGTILILEE